MIGANDGAPMSNELRELRNQALPLGLYVGEHRQWTEGPYFVAYFGKHEGGGILKYATAEQVRTLLFEHAKPAPPKSEAPKENELFGLRNLARPLGFYVGEHKDFNPTIGGGPYYVMTKKTRPDERCPTLLKYATADQIEDFLNRAANGDAA